MNASTGISLASTKTSARWMDRVAQVNRELWLLLSLFMIAGLLNWLVASHGMVLGFYTLPTLFSAYVYGRKHAVLTAVGSVLLVVVVVSTPIPRCLLIPRKPNGTSGSTSGCGPGCSRLWRMPWERCMSARKFICANCGGPISAF